MRRRDLLVEIHRLRLRIKYGGKGGTIETYKIEGNW